MKKLSFRSTQDFSEYFQGKSPELTDSIVHSIREAFTFNKRTANLFEISFDGSDSRFEISLNKKEWLTALGNCLSHYEEWSMHDDAIDTWQLIEDIKKW